MLYICENCGSIEDTAFGGYWTNVKLDELRKCSFCNYGKWHDRFERRNWRDIGVDRLIELEDDKELMNARRFLRMIGEL